MSATVDIYAMAAQIRNAKAILMGVFLQFVILPVCGFLVVKFLELERSMGISLLVVTSSPGGSYSNWWCSMFNADLALSVTMTAISTLLSVFLMPANLLIYCKYAYDADVVESLDFNSLFIALSVVISAIGLGLFASGKIHSYRFNILANKVGNYAGVALVAFSALMSNSGGDNHFWNHTWQFYVGVMLPCLAGLLISNILTSFIKLDKPERVTLSVECCYQNVGIATSVGENQMPVFFHVPEYSPCIELTLSTPIAEALTMFKGDELAMAMSVPLYYGLIEAVILGLYCTVAWKANWTKAPSKVSFLTMLTTSYEVLILEHSELKAVEVSLPKHHKDYSEKVNMSGDTIYIKYSMEEEEEHDVMALGCIPLPTYPKEASGYQLPEVPGVEVTVVETSEL